MLQRSRGRLEKPKETEMKSMLILSLLLSSSAFSQSQDVDTPKKDVNITGKGGTTGFSGNSAGQGPQDKSKLMKKMRPAKRKSKSSEEIDHDVHAGDSNN
jgi:hypothetical protein